MRKRRILGILATLALCLILLSMTTFAAEVGTTFEKDGITYEVTSTDTVSVVKRSDGQLYAGDVTIPQEVTNDNDKTYTVTAIGNSAFARCVDLGAVTLPGSIKTIGQEAFAYVSNGRNNFSITLNYGLETIESKAFSGSRKLTSINIPATVTAINGEKTFDYCQNLTTVTFSEGSTLTAIPGSCFSNTKISSINLPNTVTSIGSGAFSGCTNLTSFTIPDGVKELSNSLFYNSGLQTVDWGSSTVTKIGKNTFKNTCLTGEFTIPATVTEIGIGAFSYTDFSKISFGENSQLKTVGSSAFLGCGNLTEIAFPNTVTELPEKVLESCSLLTKVTLPNSISAIPANAFKNCSSLTSITIPETVAQLNATAFSGCTSLTTINTGYSEYFTSENGLLYNGDKTELLRVFNYNSTTYEIPDSVTTIAEGALVGTGITTVTFPESSTRTVIAANMFKGCTNLTSITLPDSLTTIEAFAFYGCTGLTKLEIPAGVTTIGQSAFASASNLNSISLSSALTELGTFAFSGCSKLEAITIPDQLKVVPDRAFNSCSGLKTVNLPNGLLEIGDSAFYGTSALEDINIPEGTTVIGSEAFASSGLKKAVIPASVTSIGTSSFPVHQFDRVYIMLPTNFTVTGSGSKNIYQSNLSYSNVTVYCPADMADTHQSMLGGNNGGATIHTYGISLSDTILSIGESYSPEVTKPSDVILTAESDSTFVTIDQTNGLVITAAAPGTATITVRLKLGELVLLEKTCQITVAPAVVPVESISLEPTELNLYVGDHATLTATVEPSDATDKAVTWESGNATVATVNENGVVTAQSEGTATITAKAGDKMAVCEVTVIYSDVTSVTLNESSLSLAEGGSATLTATVLPASADQTVTWSSSNEAVASVDENGVVTAVSEGTATITATAGGKTATCTVTVTNEGAVLPAVEESKPSVSGSITDEGDKKTASDVAGSVAADNAITSAAQSAANSLNNSSEKEELIADGEEKLNVSGDDTVSLYTQTYLAIEATGLAKDEHDAVTSITLDITPMMRVVASTATNSADIKLESNGDTNAVVVKDAEELKITAPAEITVTLPRNFATYTVYVKHQASSGTYFYKAVADSNGNLTFTSYHGFSPFTFSLTNEAVAEVNNVGYASFQEAVDAVQDGQTITVYRSGLSATVSGNKTFYVSLADGVSQYPTLTAADGYVLLDNGNGIYTVYKRPASSGGVTPPTHDISVDSGSHGDVEVWPEEAKQGTTVTITATPDKGYEVAEVIVTAENSKEVTVTDKGNNKYTFMMPGSDVTIEVTFQPVSGGSTSGDLTITAPAGWVNPYTDVAANAWYYDAVGYATANGLMGGVGSNAFDPSGSMNRAMVWTVIARLAGQSISGSTWAEDARAWAVAQGISDGTNPDGAVSREELVTMLYRYAGSPAMNVPELGLIGNYPDSADVSGWAESAFAWAISKGIIEGRDGKLAAGEVLTRAEAATILARFHLLTK